MSDSAMTMSNNALAAKQVQEKSYRKKGIFIALMSGFLYGGYTAFLTQGMASGIWVDYYGGTGVAAGLSAFALVYTLSAVGAAVNDICSAVWSLIYAAIIGRLGDFTRSINTKPGRILILAAIIGGPLASTAYVIGLQMAGSIIVRHDPRYRDLLHSSCNHRSVRIWHSERRTRRYLRKHER